MTATVSETKQEQKIDLAKLEDVLFHYRGFRGALIPVLQKAQHAYGYLPRPVIERIGESLKLHVSDIYGVITFYSQFRLKPQGKYVIRVCRGTACHVKGSQTIAEKISEKLGIELGETTVDLNFTAEEVACVGACGMAPVMTINEETYGLMTVGKATEAIDGYLEKAGSNLHKE